MILSLFRRRVSPSIGAVYGEIVSQARKPAFYQHLAAPDTVEGRFEMIVVHLALLFKRLEAPDATAADRAVAADVLDHFFTEIDASMREMGVSDVGVPKKIRKLAEAWGGRFTVYAAALAARDGAALAAALRRNLYARPAVPQADALAAYLLQAYDALNTVAPGSLMAASQPWPWPSPPSGSAPDA